MDIPTELLTSIASHLSSNDLANFRLVNRKWAQATISLIPRHGLSVINISRDIKELQHLLICNEIANNVKTLRIFHAEWPICSRYEWETHSLLFGGNNRFRNSNQFPTSASTQRLFTRAFKAYNKLITEQQRRRYSEETESLFQIFIMLRNLKTIQISDMHEYFWNSRANRRFHRLQRSIWISPFHSNNVTRTVEAVLIAAESGIKNIQRADALQISGCFDPKELFAPHSPFAPIRHLKIHDFRMCENETMIRDFLQGFPNLSTLSVSFQGWGPSISILKSLHWPKLEQLEIRGMWTSEAEFVSILENHSKVIKQFRLHSPALTEGSWQSLFTKIRALGTQAEILLSGELYGRTSAETLDMDCDQTRSSIAGFLEDHESVWPFSRH